MWNKLKKCVTFCCSPIVKGVSWFFNGPIGHGIFSLILAGTTGVSIPAVNEYAKKQNWFFIGEKGEYITTTLGMVFVFGCYLSYYKNWRDLQKKYKTVKAQNDEQVASTLHIQGLLVNALEMMLQATCPEGTSSSNNSRLKAVERLLGAAKVACQYEVGKDWVKNAIEDAKAVRPEEFNYDENLEEEMKEIISAHSSRYSTPGRSSFKKRSLHTLFSPAEGVQGVPEGSDDDSTSDNYHALDIHSRPNSP